MRKVLSTVCFTYALLCLVACVVTLDPNIPTILAAAVLTVAGLTIADETEV